MEAVNGVAAGPPPPSPLTGCYLLVVLGEPHTGSHKDIILQRLAKGLLSWNVNDCLVDLEKELTIVTEQGLEGEEARYGERLIQFASENLVTEILIHPSVSTLVQCVRNLLSSFTRHRHIIHAGYTFAANGSWILQDGTFSLADFSEAFQEIDVQRVIRAYENGISFDIHCSPEGEWMKLPKESFTRGCKLRVNPDDVLDSGSPAIANFVNYISPFLIPAELENILESSDVVGNIRFSRPTLYVFPGGQGDAALFGINGFNMLVDGGFSRKACFWDFVRHLDRLDAVMLTRLNNSNANGIGAVLRRKAQNAVYPQIGHFFCNIQNRKANLSPDGDKDKDPLVVNLLEEGQELISNLRSLELNPQLCYRDSEPINLYHKVGHGTLDMYVINPAKDSREVKEFLLRWNSNDHKLFANHKFSRECMLPLQNIVSICALLVWRPANPNDTITRILFPGSAPQNKIFEGLDRLKNLECIKHTVCTERTLAPPPKLKSKENILERIVPPEKPKLEMKRNKPRQTPENKLIEDNLKNGLQNGHAEKTVKKSGSVESDKSESKPPKPKREENKLTESNKQEKEKTQKSKPETNGVRMRQKPSEKKPSPPTPKKTVDSKKSEVDKETTNQRVRSKISPSATPAKSTKDATNRRVLESKSRTAPKREVKEPKQTEKKEEPKKVERKPISRRPKTDMKLPQSPVKRAINGSHKPDSISRKSKLDRDVTTDSSTVSTPSVDQDTLLKKDLSKLTPEEVQQLKAQELAELKEEQEAIKELEAVFRKGDKITEGSSDLRKVKDISIEDKTDTEEYLIVEKEVIEPTQPEESEADAKEEETVKLARDSEESEKKRDESETKDDRQVDTEQEESGIGEQETEEGEEIQENEISKEPSIQSPEENKRIISKDEEMKEQALESQPDEKVSANIESGATTTAPTLPEDERIPLNEIKEDIVDQIEEKHVKEETKEKETKEEIPVITFTTKTAENITKLPSVVGIRLDKETRIRDIVKTPDEVADLPVHEEVDVEHLSEFTHERVKSKDELYGDSPVKDEEITSPKKSEESPKEDEKVEAATEEIAKKSEVKVTEEPDKSNVKEHLEKSPLQEEIDVHVETTIKPVEVAEKHDDTKKEDQIKLKDDTQEKQSSVEKHIPEKKIAAEPVEKKDTPQEIVSKKDTTHEETMPEEDIVQKKAIIEEKEPKDEKQSVDQKISSVDEIKEKEEVEKESKDIDENQEKSDVKGKVLKEDEKLETTILQPPEIESKVQKEDILKQESETIGETEEICTSKLTETCEQKIDHKDEATGKVSQMATPVENIESALAKRKTSVTEKLRSPSPSKTVEENAEKIVDDVQKDNLSGEAQREDKISPEKGMSLYSELKQEELKAEELDKEQQKKVADERMKDKDEESHKEKEESSNLISGAKSEEKKDKIQTEHDQSIKASILSDESKEEKTPDEKSHKLDKTVDDELKKAEEITTSSDQSTEKIDIALKGEDKQNEIPTGKVEHPPDAKSEEKEDMDRKEKTEEKDDHKLSAETTLESSRNEQEKTPQTDSETKIDTSVHSELDVKGAKEERKMSITEKKDPQTKLEDEREVDSVTFAESLQKEEKKSPKTHSPIHSELDIEEEKGERKMSITEKEQHEKILEDKKEVDLGITVQSLRKEEKNIPQAGAETKTDIPVHSELDTEDAKEDRKMSITEKVEHHPKTDDDFEITAEDEKQNILQTDSVTKIQPSVQSELDKEETKEERKMSIAATEDHLQELKDEKRKDSEKSSESKIVEGSKTTSHENVESHETTQPEGKEESVEIYKDKDSSELKKSRSPSPSKISEKKSSKIGEELEPHASTDLLEPKEEGHQEAIKETETKEVGEIQEYGSMAAEKLPAHQKEELKEIYPAGDKHLAEKEGVLSREETRSIEKEESETVGKEEASEGLEQMYTQKEEKKPEPLMADEKEQAQKTALVGTPEKKESISDQGKASEVIQTQEEKKSDDSKASEIEEEPIIPQQASEQKADVVQMKQETVTEEKIKDMKVQDDAKTEKQSENKLDEKKESITETPEKTIEQLIPEKKSEDVTADLSTLDTIETTKVPESPRSPSVDDRKEQSTTQPGEQKSPTDKDSSTVHIMEPSEKQTSLVETKEDKIHKEEKSSSSDEKKKLVAGTQDLDSQKSIKAEEIETTAGSRTDDKSEKMLSKPDKGESDEMNKSSDKIEDLVGKIEGDSTKSKSPEEKTTVDDSVKEEKSVEKTEENLEKKHSSDIELSSSPVQQITPIKPKESTADSHDRKSSNVSLKEEPIEIPQTDMEKVDKEEDDRKASIEKIESTESFLTRKFSVVHAEKEILEEAEKDKPSSTSSSEMKEKSPDSISSGETSTTVTTEKETPELVSKTERKESIQEKPEEKKETSTDTVKDITSKTDESDEKIALNEQKISESTSHKDIEKKEGKISAVDGPEDVMANIKAKEETCKQVIEKEGTEHQEENVRATDAPSIEGKSPKEISRTSSPIEKDIEKVTSTIKTDEALDQSAEENKPSVDDTFNEKKPTLETIPSEKKLDSSKPTLKEEISTVTIEETEKATPVPEVKKEIEKADEKADHQKDKPISPIEKQSQEKTIEKVHDLEQRDNKYASMSAEVGEESKDINLNSELKLKDEIKDVDSSLVEKSEKESVQIDKSVTKTPEDVEKIEVIEKQDHESAETEKGSVVKKVEEQTVQKVMPLNDIKDFLEQEKLHSHKERGSLGEIPTTKPEKSEERSEKGIEKAEKGEEKSEKAEEKSDKSEEKLVKGEQQSENNEENLEKTSDGKPQKESIPEKIEHKEDGLISETHQEKGIIEPKEKQEQTSEIKPSSIISDDKIMKTEKIKIDLTDKPEHAEPVLLKSTPESPVINIVPPLPVLPTDIDKAELGRKSPAEREEDVAKIVASVATVLKSDAPLEEFHKQIPLYTTELRETHITTCDSPVTEKDINIELLEEKDWKNGETEFLKDLESSIIPDKTEQIEESKSEEPEDSGTVHRMLVTASSEDGGEETEICPAGTIIFSRSSESSGRSSPENMSRKLSQTSSNLDTISDQTTVKDLTDALSKKEPVIEEVCKSSKGVLEGARKSDKDHSTQQIYPDIDLKKEVKSLEDQLEEAFRTDKKEDETKDEEKEEKRSEIQEILSEALQDVSRDAEDIKETVAGKIGNVFGSIFSGASKVSEALSHTLSDSVKAVETSIDEGIKKVENEIDEVKHKIEDAETKVVDKLVEKKEMAEHIVADHLRESVSAISDTIDKTDKAKDSLVKQTEDTLDKMAAPLRETLGDALSNLAESLKQKEEKLEEAQKEEKEHDSKEKPTTTENVETDEIKKWIVTSGGEITEQIYPSLKDDLKNVGEEVKDVIHQRSDDKKDSSLEKQLGKVEESITSVISDATKDIEEALGKLEDTEDISSGKHEEKSTIPEKSELVKETEQLGKIIDQKISGTIEDLGDIVQEAKKTVVDDVTDKVKVLKDENEEKLEDLKENISGKLEEPAEDLVNKIEQSQKTVEEKMSEIGKSVTEKNEKMDEVKENLGSTIEAVSESIEKDVNGLIQMISDTKEQIGDSTKTAMAEGDEKIEKMEKAANICVDDLKDDISSLIHDSGETQHKVSAEVEKTTETLNEFAKDIAQESKASLDTLKEGLQNVGESLKKETDSFITKIIDDVKLPTKEVPSDETHSMEKTVKTTSDEEKDPKEEASESTQEKEEKDSLLSRLETKAENMINSYTDEIKDTLKESSGTAEEDAKLSFESIKHDIDVKDMQKEISEMVDAESKTAQSVISDISNIVKEEIDSSLKDLAGAEQSLAQEVVKKSSDLTESLKSVVDTGHSLKEETKSTIKDLSSTIAEKSEELVEKSKGEIEKKISDVKTEVEGTKTAIMEKAESVSKDIKDTKDKVEETINETKESVEASICSIKQDLEKEKDALVHAGKEIETEVKHAVEDVFDAGKKLFGGLFGSKKSKDEKKTKEVKKISTDSKVDKEESTQGCVQKENRVSSELSGCISLGSDEKCEDLVKDKCDVMGTLGLGKSGDISETCDISKGDVQTHLGLDVSQEKKLSISDVEIFVEEKGEDSSTNKDIKTAKTDQKEDQSKVEIETKKGSDDKPHIKAEDSGDAVSSHKPEIEKHITDVPKKELTSHEVQSVTSTIDSQKSPFGDEKVSDSEDDFASQIHHKMSEQMDPMMMSFYGALPDDDRDSTVDEGDDFSGRSEVPLTHLHDLTKAKFDGKKFQGATGVLEFPAQDPMTSSFYGELPSDKDDKDPIEGWGKPLGLPSPAPPNEKSTPKKERKLPSNVMAKNRINDDRARSESPSKNKKKINPVYVDLTYVPHHGNSNYAYVDFFKKVRARYYVFSGIEPSREVYNALLEAKQTWEDKDLEVTIIPTYDTDVLGYWVAENEELLTKYKIDLSPSASRCTINLQDHETSCSAYRLEF